MKRTLIENVKAARRVSVPLLAINTPDQQACQKKIGDAVGNGDIPKIAWDAVRGFIPLNELGNEALQQFGEDVATTSPNPMEAIMMASRLPSDSMLFWHNAQRFVSDAIVAQGMLNLRDAFKSDGRMLIQLGPSFQMPPELAADVVVLDDPLPDDEELIAVLASTYEAAALEPPDGGTSRMAADAARGLHSFGAEQVYAMSLTKEGLDMDNCWERKIAAVNQTRGLTVTRTGPETFDGLGGLLQATSFIERRFRGPDPPGAIAFIDEIEKGFAAVGTDTTGVSQDFHRAFLTWMEDSKLDGMILVGPPGSGKTAFAKAVGNSNEIPTITMDLGAMKGSLVGESEAAVRNALKQIDSIAAGRVFVIATCNKLDVLPPELRRRFLSGTWYFDLPTEEEREVIWQIHTAAFNIIDTEQVRPKNEDWTGAEIRNCCKLAWSLACSLVEAAAFVVPVAKGNPDAIKRLRDAATGRWLSANYPGTYKQQFTATSKRAIGGLN